VSIKASLGIYLPLNLTVTALPRSTNKNYVNSLVINFQSYKKRLKDAHFGRRTAKNSAA
jgi:hypothetical protein